MGIIKACMVCSGTTWVSFDGGDFECLDCWIKKERKGVEIIMERAHWALLHCKCIKSPTESQYNRGYLKGWNDCKRIAIDIIKKAVELVKKKWS